MLGYIVEKNNGTISYTRISGHMQIFPVHEYTVVMNGITRVYTQSEIQRVGEHYVIDSAILVYDFSLNQTQATHQVHNDIFHSVDDAALAWSLTFYNASAKADGNRGLEFASAIYEHEGGYSFGEPTLHCPYQGRVPRGNLTPSILSLGW